MFEATRGALARWIQPKQNRQRAHELLDQAGFEKFLSGMVTGSAPSRRGTAELMRAYRKQPILRQTVHRIAESNASTEWLALFPTRGGKAFRHHALQRSWRMDRRHAIAAKLRKQQELVEAPDHPFLALIEGGNPFLDGMLVQQLIHTYLSLKGESFTMLVLNAQGRPFEMWPIPPHWVDDVPTPSRDHFVVRIGAGTQQLPSQMVLWIKDPDPERPYGRGSGTAEALADELDSDEYAANFIKSFWYNHAMPDALVSLLGASPEQVEGAKVKWDNRTRGPLKAHRTHFTNFESKVQTFNSTFKDMDTVELRKFHRDMAHQAFGMPPEVLGIIENSKRSTIEAALFIFANLVQVPLLDRVRNAYQNQIAPLFDDRLVVDFVSPVPADTDRERKAAEAAPWSITRNEWRKFAGLGPREGGDVYLQPLNLIERPADDPNPLILPAMVLDAQGRPTKYLPPSTRQVGPNDVENILESLRPEKLTVPLEDLWSDEIQDWMKVEVEALGVQPTFNFLNPRTIQHLNSFGADRITGLVVIETREQLRRALVEGVRAGEGIPALSARVADVMGQAKGFRSVRIARTEVNRSANFGTLEAQRLSGVVTTKMWIATPDGRVRDSHIDLDGDEQPLDGWFEANGLLAQHPGGFGDASEDVHCRCTLVAGSGPNIQVTYDAAQRKAVWEIFDRRVMPWEDKAVEILQQSFADLERDVLESLARFA